MDTLRIILIILGVLLVLGIYLADRLRRRRVGKPADDWYEIDGYNEEAVSREEMEPDAAEEPPVDEWVGKAFVAQRNDALDPEQLDKLKGIAGQSGQDNAPLAHSPMYAERITAADLDVSSPVSAHAEVAHADARQSEPAPEQRAEQTAREQVVVLTLMAPEGTRLRGTRLLKALQDSGMRHGDMDIFHYTPEGLSRPLFSAANILEPGRFVLSEIAQLETPGIALFMQLPAQLPAAEALQQMLRKARQIAASLGANLCDGQRRPLDDKGLAELERRVLGNER